MQLAKGIVLGVGLYLCNPAAESSGSIPVAHGISVKASLKKMLNWLHLN